MPLEWLDTSVWRLPSGKALAEFALQAGFLAPLLFNAPSGVRWGSSGAESLPSSVKPLGSGGRR